MSFSEDKFHCLWVEWLHGGQFQTLHHVHGALLVFLEVLYMDIGNGYPVIDEFHLYVSARAVFGICLHQFVIEWNAGICFCIHRP